MPEEDDDEAAVLLLMSRSPMSAIGTRLGKYDGEALGLELGDTVGTFDGDTELLG